MSLTVRRVSRVGGDPVDVEIELGEPIIVRVTDVHPIALADAVSLVRDAAVHLNRDLRPTDAE